MDTQNNIELSTLPTYFFVEPDEFALYQSENFSEDFEDFSQDLNESERIDVSLRGLNFVIQPLIGNSETNVGGSDEIRFVEFSSIPQLEEAIAEADPDDPFLEIFAGLEEDTSFEDFESTVLEQEEAGLQLTDVNFLDYGDGEGRWNSFYTEEASTVTYVDSDNIGDLTDLVNVQILEREKGIVNIEYGDGTWIATLDEKENTGATTASGKSNFDDIISEIDRRDEQDFDLVDLEYGDGEWFARFGDNPGTSTYTTSEDYETFETQVEAQEEDGFDLIDVEYVDDAWYGVYDNTASIPIEEVTEPVSSSASASTSVSQPTFSPPADLRFNAVLANNAQTFNSLNF